MEHHVKMRTKETVQISIELKTHSEYHSNVSAKETERESGPKSRHLMNACLRNHSFVLRKKENVSIKFIVEAVTCILSDLLYTYLYELTQ